MFAVVGEAVSDVCFRFREAFAMEGVVFEDVGAAGVDDGADDGPEP